MPHKLSLLVKFDAHPITAVLVVEGCLTIDNCRVLLPVIRRVRAVVEGMTVTVDLTAAKHIEASAIRILEQSLPMNAPGTREAGEVLMNLPAVLPVCPAGFTLG
jgi:hypothetical protein